MINKMERKQRKRKHSDGGGVDVPAETAPTNFYSKKNALLDREELEYDEENAGPSVDEPLEQEEELLNVSRSFNMKKFREKLRDGDFIMGIRRSGASIKIWKI